MNFLIKYLKLKKLSYEKEKDMDDKNDLSDLCCQDDVVHEDNIDKAKNLMPDEEVLYDVAELFKVFGDSTRVRILSALACSEMCVCDIAKLLNMTKSAISHQLRVLRNNKLVKSRRDGKEINYSLADEHITLIMEMAIEHINE